MSTFELTPIAAFVLRSLHDHPDLSLPDAIAAGPDVDARLDQETVSQGLGELERRGLAERDAGGRWRVTDAGRAAHGSAGA
jgi:hypothetical protein